MNIKTAFENNHEIPQPYTCLGPNISPPLTIEAVPDGTKTFTLIFEDMDATPVAWTHWLVFNIHAMTKSMEEGRIPTGGTEGLANNHSFGYEGPCPKYFKGTHHYRLSVYAVDGILELPPESEKETVKTAMQGHILAEATLTGLCTSK